MSNKFYIVFVVLFVLSVGGFLFFKWSNGGYNDPGVELQENVVHRIKGVYLEGSFRNEEDRKEYDKVERRLIEVHGLDEIAIFYYQNPSSENQDTYKVFMGEELGSGVSVLPDTFEIREIKLKHVLVGEQYCNPTFHTIPDAMKEYLEQRCEGSDHVCESLQQDSIFEKYNESHITMELEVR